MAKDHKSGTAELLYRSAKRTGMNPTWVKTNHTFAITVNGGEHYISLSKSSLNSHLSSSLATNKHLTRLILQRFDVPNIPFMAPSSRLEARAFLDAHKKIIAKPTKGSGSRDVHIITDASQFDELKISNYILERYISGQELRFLIINSEVIAVHRSDYGVSVDSHRELKRISYPRDMWPEKLAKQSLDVASALGLTFAAVDYLVEESGKSYVLEVNTAPGMKWFHAPTDGPAVDVAGYFMEALVGKITAA